MINYNTGDLVWIPDQTVGVKAVNASPRELVIKGPTYGVVLPFSPEATEGWIKVTLCADDSGAFYLKERDIRNHNLEEKW